MSETSAPRLLGARGVLERVGDAPVRVAVGAGERVGVGVLGRVGDAPVRMGVGDTPVRKRVGVIVARRVEVGLRVGDSPVQAANRTSTGTIHQDAVR
jgi:hypothetical protein